MRIAAAITVWIALLGCGQALAAGLFDPAFGYVVPADKVRDFLSKPGCLALPNDAANKISATWTPQPAEITYLEGRLQFALKAAIRKTKWIGPESRGVLSQWQSIANHARQYAGIVVGGRKMIWVVAAPTYDFDFDGRHDMETFQDVRWHDHPIGVCDGGPGQFAVQYDSSSRQFGPFSFSGTFVGDHVP